MARGRFLWDAGLEKWAPAGEVLARRHASTPDNRSTLARPMVIGTMPPIRSMIDGKFYDSKSEYYRHVERAGCAIVGHDKNWTDHVAKPSMADDKAYTADVVADVKKAIEQVSSL